MASETRDRGGVPDDRQVSRGRFERTLAVAGRHEHWLWALVACSLLADVGLTNYGLRQGLTEGNPVVRAAVADAGIGSLGLLKAGAVALGLSLWLRLPRRERAVVPLGLCLPWVGAALVNASLLFG
ncbi:DUF5658 family protein [Halorientalis halophila]|uniref:DUF5658 family protein n=1 Tax=Halorientalis halophila TaxID=3108499 RepID=UPI00300A3F58